MRTHNDLYLLSTYKLTLILEHLRLGTKHLKKYLTLEQFSKLLDLTELNSKQTSAIKTNAIEKESKIAQAIDGFLTGIIGAWLGYIGFVESKFESRVAFITIICLATAVGIYAGYYNYRSIKAAEHEAKIKQKLHNLQLKILKLILSKKKNSISHLTSFINDALKKINKENSNELLDQQFFDLQTNVKKCLEQRIEVLKKSGYKNDQHTTAYALCKKELQITLDNSIKLFNKIQDSEKNNKKTLLKILTDPKKISPAEINSKPVWWEGKLKALSIGLFPAFLNGFGSIFFYCGELPKQLNKFGLPSPDSFFSRPTVRTIELILGLFLSLYYVLIFINNNRKKAKRQIELKSTDKHITQLEKMISEKSKELNLLKEIKKKIEKILFIINIIDNLPHIKNTQTSKSEEEKHLLIT